MQRARSDKKENAVGTKRINSVLFVLGLFKVELVFPLVLESFKESLKKFFVLDALEGLCLVIDGCNLEDYYLVAILLVCGDKVEVLNTLVLDNVKILELNLVAEVVL